MSHGRSFVIRLLAGAAAAAILGVAATLSPPGTGAEAATTARPRAYCRAIGQDDTLRPLPAALALAPAARAALDLHAMPEALLRRGTVWRCARGRVFVCNTGADLPCGERRPAVTAPTEGTVGWCAAHPDAAFVPAYVTGADMITRWRCSGGRAVGAPGDATDARGFMSRIWRVLPAAPSVDGASRREAAPR